jgi:hypothetical protein
MKILGLPKTNLLSPDLCRLQFFGSLGQSLSTLSFHLFQNYRHTLHHLLNYLYTGEAVSSVSGGEEGRSLNDEYEPNVKLYVVVACIAALVLVAIIQVHPPPLFLSAMMGGILTLSHDGEGSFQP